MPETVLSKVVFLDRDGVINRDSPDYVKSWSEFEFLPGSIEAIRNLTVSGFATILITNQSAVNRRLISDTELQTIHTRMNAALKRRDGHIQDIFFCPHRPDERCACRKPKAGLIHQAQSKYRIDLPQSFMVGDNAKDIECARNAGCGGAILVQSGLGSDAAEILAAQDICPDFISRDLAEAVNWIMNRFPGYPRSPAKGS
ncbi:MAG: D-glycero-beta-D-manno-heptose 1,7-bisphosphate 7-phosphatase [Desulfobacterales bacterium]